MCVSYATANYHLSSMGQVSLLSIATCNIIDITLGLLDVVRSGAISILSY
jgi:hypothetical protein